MKSKIIEQAISNITNRVNELIRCDEESAKSLIRKEIERFRRLMELEYYNQNAISLIGKDFIVVKDVDLALKLQSLQLDDLPESWRDKTIIVAPNGIEFLSKDDLVAALKTKQ